MMTIDALKAYGADTEDGLARCMGMEDFYLQMVELQINDPNFERLEKAYEAGDVKAAFEAAHALKGALGNLSLTPVLGPVVDITERLRGAEGPVDLSDIMPAYREALEALRALI